LEFLKAVLGIKVKANTRTLELTFLGTRGEIEVCSRRHQRHGSLLVQHEAARIMIDCRTDWLGRLRRIAPTAIVLTHAHPDHAAGLAAGAPCPVYATKETWNLIHRFPIGDRRRLPLRKFVVIDGVRFTAFPVEHSIRAPAVGYRVSARGKVSSICPTWLSASRAKMIDPCQARKSRSRPIARAID
jgi:glyoxylase-like metal-dependent hydrolase (beta-lactamase superfamily II)